MMRLIVYTNQDGGISVVRPVINNNEKHILSDEAAEARAWEMIPGTAINPRWVQESEIPVDRIFRNAWEDNDGIKVNMARAREIHRHRLRRIRKPLLEALDIEQMRSMGDPEKLSQIEAKKQELRDATAHPSINDAATPEALKAAIPVALVVM